MAFTEIRRRPAGTALDFAPELHPVLRRVYAARGVARSEDLDLSLERLQPLSSLEGVTAAVQLLTAHRRHGRVLVIGDFDADGATSSALVVRALRKMHFAHVDFLVPNRFRFGYGLTPGIVALAAKQHPSLIVTVDNGVSSVEGVDAAQALGIRVLITDHHLPGAVLPRADAIVNPNLANSRFASPALAGVGVAFYVMAALARELGETGFRVADLLDLVALGTVADVVPLDRNNRILVAQGLRRIRAGRCVPGIRALLEGSGRGLDRVSAADLGFVVAPRLNAAGRLADMSVGIACLLADEPGEAARLAEQLTRLNAARRDIEQRMQLEAVGILETLIVDSGESLGLCLFEDSWHQGIVGLVAGRIKDRVHRPVVAFAHAEEGTLRGSARSVPGVNVRDALESIATLHPGLIGKFGGHAMAAGMTIHQDDLGRFRAAFAAEIALRAGPDMLRGVVHSDGELSAAELSVDTARILRGGGPWGQGFPEPIFDGDFRIREMRIVGGKHLKLILEPAAHAAAGTHGGGGAREGAGPHDGGGAREGADAHGGGSAREGAGAHDGGGLPWGAGSRGLDAIAFGYIGGITEHADIRAGSPLRVAYRLEINEYRSSENVQLNCQHLEPV